MQVLERDKGWGARERRQGFLGTRDLGKAGWCIRCGFTMGSTSLVTWSMLYARRGRGIRGGGGPQR